MRNLGCTSVDELYSYTEDDDDLLCLLVAIRSYAEAREVASEIIASYNQAAKKSGSDIFNGCKEEFAAYLYRKNNTRARVA